MLERVLTLPSLDLNGCASLKYAGGQVPGPTESESCISIEVVGM
jgi:hypothetical protein